MDAATANTAATDTTHADPHAVTRVEQLDALFGERSSLEVVTGRVTHERWYSDTIVIPDEVTIGSTSGTDVVTDFNAEEGDTLMLQGITADDLGALAFAEADANADGTLDTVITAEADGTFSVTLLGVTALDTTGIVFG